MVGVQRHAVQDNLIICPVLPLGVAHPAENCSAEYLSTAYAVDLLRTKVVALLCDITPTLWWWLLLGMIIKIVFSLLGQNSPAQCDVTKHCNKSCCQQTRMVALLWRRKWHHLSFHNKATILIYKEHSCCVVTSYAMMCLLFLWVMLSSWKLSDTLKRSIEALVLLWISFQNKKLLSTCG